MMAPLRNSTHEAICREVAGGMSEHAAFAVATGRKSSNAARTMARPEIVARIAELRAEFNAASGISLRYLQEKLLPIATADVTRFFEADATGKLKLRDVTKLPAEVRAALSELRVDEDGHVVVKVSDKIQAINLLLKSIGGLAPQKIELAGKDGAPLEGSSPLEIARRLAFIFENGRRTIEGEIAPAVPASPIERAKAAASVALECAKAIRDDGEASSEFAALLREIASAIDADAARFPMPRARPPAPLAAQSRAEPFASGREVAPDHDDPAAPGFEAKAETDGRARL